MPLSSNLISEVIQALRNWTLLNLYSTKEAKEALRLRLFRPQHSLSMRCKLGFKKLDSKKLNFKKLDLTKLV